jgi:hypothetical protein
MVLIVVLKELSPELELIDFRVKMRFSESMDSQDTYDY